MQNSQKEQFILKFIKYGPIVFVLTLSIIITQVVLQDKQENFEREIKQIEETFLLTNKNRIKEEVDEVYNYIQTEKKNSENLLKQTIKNRVYEAHNIATNIFKSEAHIDIQGHFHSSQHILESIKNALGGIIYNNGRGYIFMDDIKGVKILQPLNKEFEGKNLLNYQDIHGYKFAQKIVETIKNKTEAYDTYYWYKGGDKENAYKKISFYKYFEPLNLAIGTGEYIDDFENELKQKVLERINKIRYAEAGYIFIYDLDGNCLAHFNKNLIGTNRINYKDTKGDLLLQKMIKYTKDNKEGFLSYDSSIRPLENIENNSKVSYLKLYKEWNWMIGTGFYTDTLINDIEKRKVQLAQSNQEALNKIIITSLVLTLVFILFSFYLSRYIRLRFDDYKQSIDFETKKTIEKEKQLVQQSKMAVMGEMIGNIAHQWKQPLSLISMSNGLLEMNNKNQGMLAQKDIDKAIKNIDTAVSHLSTTIDDFRNFFRPTKEKEYFNISKVFEKTYNLINSQLHTNNIEIHTKTIDIDIYTFQNELLQVFINIFKNSKDELVKLHSGKRLIFVNVIEDDENVIISIKDNAGGIPIEIIDKIFDSYFTTKNEEEGTGIGLYMSKQIIENMDGTIIAQNEEYKYENVDYVGAKFIITIPKKS
ncbi:MAG: cache domain-containing protein [Arcobacteraceae bacterium]